MFRTHKEQIIFIPTIGIVAECGRVWLTLAFLYWVVGIAILTPEDD